MGKLSIVARAGFVLGAVSVLVGGVTYAALQDTATVADNTIATATANLEVSLDPDCLTGFGSEVAGFDFDGVVPGGAGSEDKHFCLKNTGEEAAPLNVVLTVPALPTYTDSADAPVTVNNTKVRVVLTCTTPASFGVGDTLHALWFSGRTQGTLAPDETADCTASVNMDADAFSADSIKSSDFDLVFTGTGV